VKPTKITVKAVCDRGTTALGQGHQVHAKKLVVLADSRRALAAAVRGKGSGRRHTALSYRLRAA